MLNIGTVSVTESKSMQLGSINHGCKDEGHCKKLEYKSQGKWYSVGEKQKV